MLRTHQIVSEMETAALKAAAIIRHAIDCKQVPQLTIKSDGTQLLDLDLKCDAILSEALQLLPILSEERSASHELLTSSDECYLVDPIDGTSACSHYLHAPPGQVGFGPLIGWLKHGQLQASVFVRMPEGMLFTAIKGQGVRKTSIEKTLPNFSERITCLGTDKEITLKRAVALFFLGEQGEAQIVGKLKSRGVIANAYRFGGFANDAVRLCQGLENIKVQFSVHPWDFSASLFLTETNYSILMDPLIQKVAISSWKISKKNPMIVAPEWLLSSLLKEIDL